MIRLKRPLMAEPVPFPLARAILLIGGAASVLLSSSSAMAQQQVANGTVLTIPGGTFSTTADFTSAFLAENGGLITATAPVTLTTFGFSSNGAQALTGGTIVLNGGSVTSNNPASPTGDKQTPALRANGAGSSITVTGVAVTTNGAGAYGVISENNAAITLHGGTVDILNPTVGAAGLNTVGSGTTVGGGATITADQGLVIRASDVGAFAQGGTINLDTVTITERLVSGNTSGLRADTAPSLGTPPGLINANNVAITMSGTASVGALAVGGGKIVLTNSAISTSGTSGFGMSTAQVASTFPTILPQIDATNVMVTTSGIAAHGVFAFNGAIVNLNTVNIQTSGDTAYGLAIQGFLGTGPPILTQLNGTNVTVNTTGPNAWGIVDNLAGEVNLTDSSIHTTGTNAGGVFVGNSGSVGTLLRTTVTSDTLDGIRASGSGHLFATDSVVTAGRYGARSDGGVVGDPNIMVISGGSLTAGSDAIRGDDTTAQITLMNGTAVTTGSGNLLNVVSTDPSTFISNVNFNVHGITATGDIIADAASIATINLSNNTTITGIEQNTFATVDASSKWIMNGNSDIHSDTLAGQELFTPPTGDVTLLASYKTLTTGSYIGQGGTIGFNTYLNDDTAPSDRLVINGGTASGNSSLHFTNTGGPGALTTANGILVVSTVNGATTAAGAFTMANPELRAGAFDYRLFRGGLNGSDPDNWFLRSTFGEGPIPPEVLPPTPPTPGPGMFPIIGPELATYGVVQPMAQQLGRAMLGTHDERLGDLYQLPCQPTAPIYTKAPVYTKAPIDCGTNSWRPAVWGRLFGQQIDNRYQAFANPRADGQIAGFQAGVDLLRNDSLFAGHTDYAGFYAAYGNANVDVSGFVTNAAATAFVLQHTGSLNLNAYSGGAYWTHYGVPGWYLDLTLQGTSYDGGASTEFAALKTTGSGFISSLEGGYPIALPVLGPGFVLEPQAQVLWQWIGFDSGNDGLGPVALGTTSTTTARLGLKGRWTITDGGQVWQPYVRTNVWSDFGPTSTTLFGSDMVPLISRGQYMDVDAGFTTKIDTHFSAFAEAGYQFAISNDGGGKRDGVKGTAGLRYQW